MRPALTIPGGLRARRYSRRGFTLVEVMVAVAIMFSGAVTMIYILPKLSESATRNIARDLTYSFALSKMEELLSIPYADVGSVPLSGNFGTLLPGVADAASYQWNYTAAEEMPNRLKRVNLSVSRGDIKDSYVFFVPNL